MDTLEVQSQKQPRLVNFSWTSTRLCAYKAFTNLCFTFASEFNWKDTVADKVSTFYDIGGIIGNDDK